MLLQWPVPQSFGVLCEEVGSSGSGGEKAGDETLAEYSAEGCQAAGPFPSALDPLRQGGLKPGDPGHQVISGKVGSLERASIGFQMEACTISLVQHKLAPVWGSSTWTKDCACHHIPEHRRINSDSLTPLP